VTYVLDEPRHKGFAYGTLPGHPERGEEAFALELHDDGAVTFTITAFSRPASLLAKAGGSAQSRRSGSNHEPLPARSGKVRRTATS
jgi:uncharacterized protein (UPF0548 family)